MRQANFANASLPLMPMATPNAMGKQLVQGGTASERQLGSEKFVVVNGHQTTADEQILLNLIVL